MIHGVGLLLALTVAATLVSGQDQDESGRVPLDIRRECPDTPVLPYGIPSEALVLRIHVPTRANERVYRELMAELGAQCRGLLMVDETRRLAERMEQLCYAADSGESTEQNLDQRSDDIEKTTGRFTAWVNFGTDSPEINVAPLPKEGLDVEDARSGNFEPSPDPQHTFDRGWGRC